MGLANQWHLEQLERGWSSKPDRWVCTDCIDEEALVQLVRDTATHSVCSYCGTHGSRPIAAELDVVVEALNDGLSAEYGSPANEGVSWEKGWALGGVVDTWDLLWEFGTLARRAFKKTLSTHSTTQSGASGTSSGFLTTRR